MTVYKCDGTRDGILCCIFESFLKKEQPVAVYSNEFQPSFDMTIKTIETDAERTARVRKAIIKSGGISLLSQLFYPLRSFDETKETVIFKVAFRCVAEKRNVLTDYSDLSVIAFSDLTHKISYEIHRMHGFIRFRECVGGMYAHFEPDNDIVDLVAPHFAKRFAGEKFILHDTRRNIMVAYDGKSLQTFVPEFPVSVYLTEDELVFDSLWKTYFNSVAIASRKNTRQQDNYLPRRYRKNMNEFL